MNNSLKLLIQAVFFIGLFLFGLFQDQMGMKFFAVGATGLSIIFLLSLPNRFALFLVFTFIYFQGFLKIISNYHPIVHVGADLILIAMIVKVLVQKSLEGSLSKFELPPLSALFLIHFIWIGVVFFNPYSLGIVASLAGSKVYISMFTLFFFGYYLSKNLSDVHKYFTLFIILASVQLIFTIYQGFIGVESVIHIHPGYLKALQKYQNYAFRPFGLTNLPGAPSVYIYTSLPFVLYFSYFSKNLWVRLMCLLFLPLAGLGLTLCQVRSAIIKGIFACVFLVATFLTSRYPFRKGKRFGAMMGALVTAGLLIFSLPSLLGSAVDSNDENNRAVERSLSSFDLDSISSARRGAWGRFLTYSTEIPFGAGFARTGASKGAFKEANLNDEMFSKYYFFSDNLFIALIIEIGLPGCFLVTLLICLILGKGLRAWRSEERVQLIGPQLAILSTLLAIFIGSYGAEGIIYNPESAFFWFFSGVLIKTLSKEFNENSIVTKSAL